MMAGRGGLRPPSLRVPGTGGSTPSIEISPSGNASLAVRGRARTGAGGGAAKEREDPGSRSVASPAGTDDSWPDGRRGRTRPGAGREAGGARGQAQLSLPVTPMEQALSPGSSSGNLVRKRSIEDFAMRKQIGEGSYSTVRTHPHGAKGTATAACPFGTEGRWSNRGA